MTERFEKMVTVAGGPVSSGSIKLEKLNRGDCSDIKVAVAALNIQLNAVVKRCCAELDDQEGLGFLGADLLGVELIRGGAAPTEGNQIGLQIDNLLAETKATEGKLRQAARTRKSKLRGKQQASDLLDAKLLAIDEKLAADRATLWGSFVELELHQGEA